MLKDFLRTFRAPSARVLAQKEFEEAQRSLLEARSATEYAASMVTYHESRVVRLAEYLRSEPCQ